MEAEANPTQTDDTAPDQAQRAAVVRYGKNDLGRDFVVGDIHGMFEHLEVLLSDIEFDGTRDRLFSVGDLVDRGPKSSDALRWLDEPWFYACRGNHEQLAIDSEDEDQLEVWVEHNGGRWWLKLSVQDQALFRERFQELPLAMEVETDTGLVGIVHADVPPLLTWDRFMDLLTAANKDAMFYAMWSRNRISGNCSALPVQGRVSRVYCGHTPIRETLAFDNVHFIDTGAAYSAEGYRDARLTIVEVHPARHREFAINTFGGL
jgi:serine/threonine protein phosphatase 1